MKLKRSLSSEYNAVTLQRYGKRAKGKGKQRKEQEGKEERREERRERGDREGEGKPKCLSGLSSQANLGNSGSSGVRPATHN